MEYAAKVDRLVILAHRSPIAMQCLSSHKVCMEYAPLERHADVDECLLDALEATTEALSRTIALCAGDNRFLVPEIPLPLPSPGKSYKAHGTNYNGLTLKDRAWECVGLVFGYVAGVLGDDCGLSRDRNAVIFSRPSTGQDYSLDLSTFAATMLPARALAAQIAGALSEGRPPR